MGYTHIDVSAPNNFAIGAKGSEVVIAGAGGALYQAGVEVTATAAELIAAADNSVQAAKMAASTVMTATLESYQTSVVRTGDIIKTTIAIDLTGAKSTTTDLDVIGDTGACHIGQITTAINGIIYKGKVSCGEVPATGVTDIDIYSSTAATGAYDADASGLAGAVAILTSGGAHAVATHKTLTALPAANAYLYLACGAAGTVGTYTAGKLFIELWGTVA
jgi:hypothetical protein